MRALAEPEVLRNSIIAAAVSAAACFARLQSWQTRHYPVWYMEAVLFLGSIVFWAFVFGWHTRYSGKPLFTLRPDRIALGIATACGVLGALAEYHFLDPTLRTRAPEAFPADLGEWFARLLWNLTFVDLFLVFAPFDWLLRLSRSTRFATALTMVFGMFVIWLEQRAFHERLPSGFLALVLCGQAFASLLSVYFYLQGGVLLVWWCHLLIQSRHIWHFVQ